MRHISLILLAAMVGTAAAIGAADVQNSDPSEWTGPEIFRILNNSAWSKTSKVNVYGGGSDSFANQNAGNTASNANTAPPGAGMGRRGMGGGRSQTTYTSGRGGSSGGGSGGGASAAPTEVTIQWQSALVVRMAEAKKNGDTAQPASFKPLDEYVIAVIGLPITAVGGPAASADASSTVTAEQEQRVENRVKGSTSLVRSGHEPLTPTKIELDQGKDGRMLIHFPKTDPIKPSDKTVEFRLAMTKGEIRRKFVLKEMEYRGNLEL